MPSPKIIVGIDVSLTNTGLAAIRYDKGIWLTAGTFGTKAVTKDLKDPCRQFEILKAVRGFCRMHRPDTVVIEDYAFGRSMGKASTRAELVGMIKQWVLVNFGVPVYLVSPLALKKFMDCAGKKNQKDKDAMFEAASRRFKFISADDDIVDAYCLTRYLAANKDGQILTLVRLDPMPHYREITVQVAAPKKVSIDTKNRLLTTSDGKPTLQPLRRIRV